MHRQQQRIRDGLDLGRRRPRLRPVCGQVQLLDGAAGLVNKVTGGKHADKVEEVRANIDKQVGNE